ncbi:ABC transporter permease [Leptospira meyeri]|uniref:Transport permease protein n=2 Tax=Leptospira meyeri TaxID=29508 RepID=A0A4V3HIA7_LEPME|nr:ABC transporter permease [Leptospira meyeri]EKJ88648.1 ABC-2 type transporter [Leptospira meyeri serovar Hardjo str. Went 5]EMJ86511.1 ABC-2 type transporter [Leptospira meyeri serovar Semaranga str. Veldrot Semarang 173]TDY71191.1 lipopolysaccharide transport system permease protein [Leptospira meyeri]TGL52968.1 ABC transporter permease [Leptospira meyeri]
MNSINTPELVEDWDLILEPRRKWYSLRLGEIIRYRDLLFLFVRRDIVSVYKQTILGPIWFFIQPVLTSLTFAVIFGVVAGIATDGIPNFLFYLSGITIWNYFADTLVKTSDTFVVNAAIFGKVYFPRLIVPISIAISNLVKFFLQFVLLLGVMLFYSFLGTEIKISFYYLLIPFLIFLMGIIGLGFGIIISSLTTKYRDLKFLVNFGVQLLMYCSPIVFPLSIVTNNFPKMKLILLLNPVTSLIEAFRFILLGVGVFDWVYLGISLGFTIVLVFLSIIIFNRVERSFIDTV